MDATGIVCYPLRIKLFKVDGLRLGEIETTLDATVRSVTSPTMNVPVEKYAVNLRVFLCDSVHKRWDLVQCRNIKDFSGNFAFMFAGEFFELFLPATYSNDMTTCLCILFSKCIPNSYIV
jgi:hypothetical protein